MTDEIRLIKQSIPELNEILNLCPGQRFQPACGDIIVILQRRMEESDLLQAVRSFVKVLSAENQTTMEMIAACGVALLEMRVLTDAEACDFNPLLKRELIRLINEQTKRTENILKLSKINLMTAAEDQKDRIQLTVEKNQCLLAAYEKKRGDTEADLEKNGSYIQGLKAKRETEQKEAERREGKAEKSLSAGEVEENSPDQNRVVGSKKSLVGTAGHLFKKASDEFQKSRIKKLENRLVGEQLIAEEKKSSDTRCREIPFYETGLICTWSAPCKDLPGFSLMKRKDNIFFGKSANLARNSYNNKDQSLLELTEATEDFLQFMTENLLSEEYELSVFSEGDKETMALYFEFVCSCFEKHIGLELSVRDYLSFKEYYNRLVTRVFELEETERNDYYRALRLTEMYQQYMAIFDMKAVYEKERLIRKIMEEDTDEILDDLRMIKDMHITEKEMQLHMEKLIQEIRYFKNRKLFPKTVSVEHWGIEIREDKSLDGSKKENPLCMQSEFEVVQCGGKFHEPYFNAYSATGSLSDGYLSTEFSVGNYNDTLAISADDIENLRIKTQFLNVKGIVIDEGLFAPPNVRNAVADYLRRPAFIKKIGLHLDGKDVFFFSSKNGSLSVPVLTDEMKKIKRLDCGIQGELVGFYEEKIRKQMIEAAQ